LKRKAYQTEYNRFSLPDTDHTAMRFALIMLPSFQLAATVRAAPPFIRLRMSRPTTCLSAPARTSYQYETCAQADRRGWQIVNTFEDAGISGTKGRDKRPGFDAMLKDANRRRFDVVMVWAIDRMGRSTA
jgi:hypothetical protein